MPNYCAYIIETAYIIEFIANFYKKFKIYVVKFYSFFFKI